MTGTLRFEPGEIVKTFLVPILDDGVLEGSGLFCSTSHGPGSGVAFFGMITVGALAIVRRRTKKRSSK